MKKIMILSVITGVLFSIGTFGVSEINGATNVYTVEKATESTIKNYDGFETNMLDKIKLRRQMSTIQNNVNTMNSMGQLTFMDKKDQTDPLIDSLVALDNSIQSIEGSEKLQKEILKNTVANLFLTIKKTDVQLLVLEEQIEIGEKNIKNDRQKQSLGVLSKIQLEKNYNGLMQIKRQYESLKSTQAKLYTSLKELIGRDNKETILLDYTYFQKYEIVPLTATEDADTLSGKNLKLEVLLDNVKRAKEYYVGVNNRYPKGMDNQKDADTELSKAELSYKNEKEVMVHKYESAVVTTNDNHKSVLIKKADCELNESELKVAELQYKLGVISKSQLDDAKNQYENALLNYESAKWDYLSARLSLDATISGTN